MSRRGKSTFRRMNALVLGLVTVAAGAVVPLAVVGGASTADAALRKRVDTDYTLLRRAPRSYVIGTAYRDWTVDVHGEQDAGYRWARVHGDLDNCLWIYSGALSGDAAQADSCGAAATMPVEQFTNGQIGGSDTDGASVATVAGAACATWDGSHIRGYGNVRPWEVPSAPSAPVDGQVAVGQTVQWRYVSRDGRWVMVRDPRAGDTEGVGRQGWYFVPRDCLPAQLPS
ncbi:hypothetical protein [Streptomyces physcomitrii]|uniref:SH3 domain-containing protein n=1 Tax=Streptomyces physcomitrii TaxID=2724184 RepID=A0ABX1H0Y4_9ACTN|nr:hypothetical protein [Streptomyces physcomitrii]NKI42006.1 hypothetical protein [Streptomyces physcomitrii]